jgi:hypothetical protein
MTRKKKKSDCARQKVKKPLYFASSNVVIASPFAAKLKGEHILYAGCVDAIAIPRAEMYRRIFKQTWSRRL